MFGDKLKKFFFNNKENTDYEIDKRNEEKNDNKNREEYNVIINNPKKQGNIGNDKRKIENLVFFVILLILTIIIINFIWNGNKEVNKKETTNDTTKQLAETRINGKNNDIESMDVGEGLGDSDSTKNLENKLKNILSKIEGVGEVEVCINYSESSEVVAMYNEDSTISTTEETDDTGGTRKIQETDTKKDVIFEEEDGVKTPITAKVVKPKIEGAIITAKGVKNAETKNNVIQAVEAVTGLATHKIQVFEMN